MKTSCFVIHPHNEFTFTRQLATLFALCFTVAPSSFFNSISSSFSLESNLEISFNTLLNLTSIFIVCFIFCVESFTAICLEISKSLLGLFSKCGTSSSIDIHCVPVMTAPPLDVLVILTFLVFIIFTSISKSFNNTSILPFVRLSPPSTFSTHFSEWAKCNSCTSSDICSTPGA
ncbi:hypothetical protein D3C76_974770 [compost metagenome]